MSFKEDRQVETVNGQPWKEKSMPEGVFRIGGGYSSIRVMVFGPKGGANYSFSPAKPADTETEPAFVVAFATRNGKQKIKGKDGVHSFQSSGHAWFDPVSFEVIRLEEHILTKGGRRRHRHSNYRRVPAGADWRESVPHACPRLSYSAPCGFGQGRARRVRSRIQRLPEVRFVQHDSLSGSGEVIVKFFTPGLKSITPKALAIQFAGALHRPIKRPVRAP
jgi:hypothetical protein